MKKFVLKDWAPVHAVHPHWTLQFATLLANLNTSDNQQLLIFFDHSSVEYLGLKELKKIFVMVPQN